MSGDKRLGKQVLRQSRYSKLKTEKCALFNNVALQKISIGDNLTITKIDCFLRKKESGYSDFFEA